MSTKVMNAGMLEMNY